MNDADAIVVGAGVVGAATARELARRGQRILLLEQGHPGGAVSGASLACISTHMLDRAELDLLTWARDAWAELARELDDFEYRVCGQLRFIVREADLPVARDWIAAERAAGLDPELLDRAAVQTLEPLLKGEILAASYSPRDAVVNPLLAVRALINDAVAHGVELLSHCPVHGVALAGERVVGVDSARGHLQAPTVILAAGPWSARLAASAGLSLPIRPRRAQCLATVRLPPSIRQVVGACESAGGVEAGYTQIQQAASGQVLFNTVLAGGLAEPGAEDRIPEVDAAFVGNSVATLLWLFPDLADVELLRSWVRYEAVTPDDRFLIGPCGPPGLWVAAGDCGTGFVRAPAIARGIADRLLGENPPFAMAVHDPARFAGTEAMP